MAFRLLASTRSAGLRPLGTAGQRSFELIRREAALLGPSHEALFAEPFPSPDGDVIDWYAPVSGASVPLDEAAPEARVAGQAALNRLIADLKAHADALSQEQDPARRRLGETLRAAMEIPDGGCVHLVGDQPVLVAWAHLSNEAQAPSNLLIGGIEAVRPAPAAPPPEMQAPVQAAAPTPPPPVPTPAATTADRRSGFGWLWWLLWGAVGALAVAVALVLLPACGLAHLPWADACPVPERSAAAPEMSRAQELEEELLRLERELQRADLACLPAPVEPRRRAQGPVCAPGETASAGETLFLLDASTSMAAGIRSPGEIDRELQEIFLRSETGRQRLDDVARWDALVRRSKDPGFGDSRIDVAKSAIKGAVQRVSPERLRLGSFNACGRLDLSPPLSDAGPAVDAVSLAPSTALAHAIERGAQSLQGGMEPGDPVNVVLVTDGYDTCGGDPCAAARRAKAERPGLAIHVFAMTDLPGLRCIADETGGSYVVAGGPDAGDDPAAALARALGGAASAGGRCLPAPEPAPERDEAEATAPDEFEQRVRREGGETQGAMSITLVWDTESDLDLWVHCPGGQRIFYRNQRACGGVLDIDQNAERFGRTREPVENVIFARPPAAGAWRVSVRNFKQNTPAPSNYRLRIRKGDAVEIREGRLSRTNESRDYTFQYP